MVVGYTLEQKPIGRTHAKAALKKFIKSQIGKQIVLVSPLDKLKKVCVTFKICMLMKMIRDNPLSH